MSGFSNMYKLRKTDGATHNQPKICGIIHNAMGGFTKSEHPHMEDWSLKCSPCGCSDD